MVGKHRYLNLNVSMNEKKWQLKFHNLQQLQFFKSRCRMTKIYLIIRKYLPHRDKKLASYKISTN